MTERTPSSLAAAARRAGAVLVSTRLVVLRDGSRALEGQFRFEDPWAAARLLTILSDEDAADPVVAAWGRKILDATRASFRRSDRAAIGDAFAAACHANVQQQIRFVPEVGEQFQSARTTMIQGLGDCDCHARLVHALARSQGLGSTLRFFGTDEPTHVVAALETSEGPAWAETTIGARFGENPQAAYRRLGLAQAGSRPDIGFLGLEFVTAGNVRDRKAELDAAVSALDADVARCGENLDDATRGAWRPFVASWRTFLRDDPSWYDAGAQGRQAAEYTETIRAWQQRLAAICTTSAPLVAAPKEEETVSVLKTVAIVVGVAGAAGVGLALARH